MSGAGRQARLVHLADVLADRWHAADPGRRNGFDADPVAAEVIRRELLARTAGSTVVAPHVPPTPPEPPGASIPAPSVRTLGWLRPLRPGWNAFGPSATSTFRAGSGRSRYRVPPIRAWPCRAGL